jgi:hypothetical protein
MVRYIAGVAPGIPKGFVFFISSVVAALLIKVITIINTSPINIRYTAGKAEKVTVGGVVTISYNADGWQRWSDFPVGVSEGDDMLTKYYIVKYNKHNSYNGKLIWSELTEGVIIPKDGWLCPPDNHRKVNIEENETIAP